MVLIVLTIFLDLSTPSSIITTPSTGKILHICSASLVMCRIIPVDGVSTVISQPMPMRYDDVPS